MGLTVAGLVKSGTHMHGGAMCGGLKEYFGGETAHHGQPTAAVSGVMGGAPATVVSHCDQQLVMVKLSLQAHHRVGVMRGVGMFNRVGQGFIDRQGKIVN